MRIHKYTLTRLSIRYLPRISAPIYIPEYICRVLFLLSRGHDPGKFASVWYFRWGPRCYKMYLINTPYTGCIYLFRQEPCLRSDTGPREKEKQWPGCSKTEGGKKKKKRKKKKNEKVYISDLLTRLLFFFGNNSFASLTDWLFLLSVAKCPPRPTVQGSALHRRCFQYYGLSFANCALIMTLKPRPASPESWSSRQEESELPTAFSPRLKPMHLPERTLTGQFHSDGLVSAGRGVGGGGEEVPT